MCQHSHLLCAFRQNAGIASRRWTETAFSRGCHLYAPGQFEWKITWTGGKYTGRSAQGRENGVHAIANFSACVLICACVSWGLVMVFCLCSSAYFLPHTHTYTHTPTPASIWPVPSVSRGVKHRKISRVREWGTVRKRSRGMKGEKQWKERGDIKESWREV